MYLSSDRGMLRFGEVLFCVKGFKVNKYLGFFLLDAVPRILGSLLP